jgi:hypothetical protein
MGAKTGLAYEGTRYGLPSEKFNPDNEQRTDVLVGKAAFFDYFLCSSKESDPPAGEAATE